MQGPRRREGGRLCQLTANTRHSHGNAPGSQLPSCPTNKMGSIQASSPSRKTQREATRRLTVESRRIWAFAEFFFLRLFYLEVLLRNWVTERGLFFFFFLVSSEVIFQSSPRFIKDSLDRSRCFSANKLFVYISVRSWQQYVAWQASTHRNKHKFPILGISQLARVNSERQRAEKGVFDDSRVSQEFL